MSKLNNKGFMMAEVIIVSTIILGTLVGLYSIFNKMYIVYTERSYYYNIDTVYALRTIYKNLIENNKMNELIKQLPDDSTNNYIELINKGNNCNNYIEENKCNDLNETYGISKVILAKYSKSMIKELNDSNYNPSMKGYFNYLNASTDFSSGYSYMFIIELVDGNYHYYGNYRIR